jgi:hypothetical protein
MTHGDFRRFKQKLIDECSSIEETKGKEYANDPSNRFGNFNRLAARLGIPNYTVGWIYLTKHLDSIESYIKNEKTFSDEAIRGRFTDAIVYLTLIAGMIAEATEKLEKESYPCDCIKLNGKSFCVCACHHSDGRILAACPHCFGKDCESQKYITSDRRLD